MALLLLLGAAFTASDFVVVSAATTQEKIDQAEKEKKQIQSEKNKNDTELKEKQKKQKALQEELNNLNQQLTEVTEHLQDLEEQIAAKENEIEITLQELADARADEEWQYECMVSNVRYMYERKEESFWISLIKRGSLSKLLNAAEYIERIAAYDRKLMDELTQIREFIEEEEARLETEKIELDNLKLEAETEKSKVMGLISQTSLAIAEYEDLIDELEEQAKAYEAELKAKEQDLKALKKQLEEELALSAAAANAKWRDISEVTFAEGDRYLLANLIYCEAGGEPYAGKLAVGAVVINRVLSSKYPDTVVGVIYAPRQFSPTNNGRLAIALAANRANADCYRAADEAMSGMTNVGNCLYFRTPIEGLTGIRIGGHIFY